MGIVEKLFGPKLNLQANMYVKYNSLKYFNWDRTDFKNLSEYVYRLLKFVYNPLHNLLKYLLQKPFNIRIFYTQTYEN